MKELPVIDRFFTIPHELDRSGQQETFEFIKEWYRGPKQYLILSAPTGIGKTGIVTSMGKHARIMSLVRTKALQDSVYSGYGYDILKGKGNYPCAYRPDTHKADDCAISERMTKGDRMAVCSPGNCAYKTALHDFIMSDLSNTTYSKFISDESVMAEACPDLYILDEAHEVPDFVIETSGFTVNTRKNKYLTGLKEYRYAESIPFEDAITIMRELYGTAQKNTPQMDDYNEDTYKKEARKHERFLRRIHSVAKLMIESDVNDLNIWHYSISDDGTFSARPLTAAYHFKKILKTDSSKVILMSATITPKIADMLGLKEDEFEFYEAPQQYPPSLRKIHDIGIGGLGTKAVRKFPTILNIQALKIANIIKKNPTSSSVVLTTSKAKAQALYMKLKSHNLDVFIPPTGMGTDYQLQAWEKYRKPGAVCVTYNFWEGVSLDDDNMLFIANIKYPDLRSPFEKARLEYSASIFQYRAAVNLAQGAGRIQRGDRSHYINKDLENKKFVFICDGNWKRVKSFVPGDFIDRVVDYDPSILD